MTTQITHTVSSLNSITTSDTSPDHLFKFGGRQGEYIIHATPAQLRTLVLKGIISLTDVDQIAKCTERPTQLILTPGLHQLVQMYYAAMKPKVTRKKVI